MSIGDGNISEDEKKRIGKRMKEEYKKIIRLENERKSNPAKRCL